MKASQVYLIPVDEMTPGMIANIRNDVIDQVVKLASKELAMPESQLVVRDIQAYTDLGWDYSSDSAGTVEGWEHSPTSATCGWYTATGAGTMTDQRYVAIFGVRDIRAGLGSTKLASENTGFSLQTNPFSFIKFNVGGADKAIWDLESLWSTDAMAGFSPAAIVIPQNDSFNIWTYTQPVQSKATGKIASGFLQLIGVTVEPRGKIVSP